ncbi:hypothetical protein [Thiomonas sp. FB-Cd]|uniref:hypothetical protein n=1 Tax=Thiomonas sp. FB-Cd TaxID=1158292 RepID=UPI0004DF8EF1|nr:hypothetical protein [Thiomonas sp. FB-Cd]
MSNPGFAKRCLVLRVTPRWLTVLRGPTVLAAGDQGWGGREARQEHIEAGRCLVTRSVLGLQKLTPLGPDRDLLGRLSPFLM